MKAARTGRWDQSSSRYDSENRLVSLNSSQAHYMYDGDGQLVSKTAGGVTTTYLIDDQTPAGYTQIAEERVGAAVSKGRVYGPQRISMRDGAGLHYYGYDVHSGCDCWWRASCDSRA